MYLGLDLDDEKTTTTSKLVGVGESECFLAIFPSFSVLQVSMSLCSCLENPGDGGAWWAAIYGVAQSRTRLKRLSRAAAPRPFQSTNPEMILCYVNADCSLVTPFPRACSFMFCFGSVSLVLGRLGI